VLNKCFPDALSKLNHSTPIWFHLKWLTSAVIGHTDKVQFLFYFDRWRVKPCWVALISCWHSEILLVN